MDSSDTSNGFEVNDNWYNMTSNERDGNILPTKQIEKFGRTVQATASQLLGDGSVTHHYQHALGEIHRELRRPMIQRSLFSFAQNSPKELFRSTLSKNEIEHRALVTLPEDLLHNIPEGSSVYSLFQGFQASLPDEPKIRKKKGHGSRGRKTLTEAEKIEQGPAEMTELQNEKNSLAHRLEMLGVRKNMFSSEIYEIDNKIANYNTMRQIVLERLADLEQEEMSIEEELTGVDTKIDVLQEELDDAIILTAKLPIAAGATEEGEEPATEADGFMSESIYGKLPPTKAKRRKPPRRISMPILHEHLQSGSLLREMQAHTDTITAIDFDLPFGTMISSALDDTVRVWDLNAGRCIGMLEGHKSSVRCLQVEDDIVATGSMDASIRLWDLSKAQYAPKDGRINKGDVTPDEDDGLDFQNEGDEPPPPHPNSMQECPLFSLEAHVAEVTALHFRGNTLVSGSADKTLRQWDLEKGRCVQTLDVLWAAAQANATLGTQAGQWRQTGGRLPDATADFVGALQVFDAALACGTADGMVRLWDLRSGQVHRSLVGHTGPITALQFDDVHLVTSSMDRSIRIWDLRTGSIFDAFGYENAITSMMFDARRIVAAAGEDVVKVYDKTDGKQWDCGPGAETEDDSTLSTIERVRIKDGYLIEGRKDGMVGVWSC